MVDYSKWDSLDVSDDEDDKRRKSLEDTLFNWKDESDDDSDGGDGDKDRSIEEALNMDNLKFDGVNEIFGPGPATTAEEMSKVMKDAVARGKAEIRKRQEEMQGKKGSAKEGKEKVKSALSSDYEATISGMKTLNVKAQKASGSSIIRDGFSSTKINVKSDNVDPMEHNHNEFVQFMKDNEKSLREFARIKTYGETREFLLNHPELLHIYTASTLSCMCVDAFANKRQELLASTSHQCVLMQFFMLYVEENSGDPRACLEPFMDRFLHPEEDFFKVFTAEVVRLRNNVASERAAKLMLELKAREKGPGGESPLDVYRSLPPELQHCFQTKDKDELARVMAKYPPYRAQFYMNRCIQSGLWVPPNANKNEKTVANN